ncbi:MAG: threonine ammonia-lyase, biosynthetic [Pantoea sp. Brub]|nr:threonine ammonia-lyase, biosynthetic [Pantoea sp. Brub]
MEYQNLSKEPCNAEYLRAILRTPVYELIQVTPLQKMKKISLRFNNTILVKREDQHPIHSFKIRGAYAMIGGLSKKQQIKGIITASAGNHAQGVAYSANKLGIKSIIVMPLSTTPIKIDAVQSFGSTVHLYGNNFDEANNKAIKLSKQFQYTFIPPFDHPAIIAGQATLAMELLHQDANIDRIFVPVGGGGLLAGIIVLIKQLIPQIKIIAVESKDSSCLKAALDIGKPINLSHVGLFAEGVAVKRVGKENFRICQKYLDDLITVDNDAICSAMKDLFEDIRAISEPSGALSLAGMKQYINKHNIVGEKLVHVLSGANINFHTLRYISERCDLGEQREALLAAIIPEKCGSFLNFCQVLGNKFITEFNYRYVDNNNAYIFIGIRLTNGLKEKYQIINNLINNGYKITDLSDNEISKLHVKYIIGGKPLQNFQERLFSFEFPEYPGALLKFLYILGNYWNISLFHYRNDGTDYGSVLAAFEYTVDQSFLEKKLKDLGYKFNDETDNPAFNFFLKKSI